MTGQTRYAKSQEKKRKLERHQAILDRLASGFVTNFEEALVEYQPECVTSDYPSPWTDWDDVTEHREPYEGEMPTAEEAAAMCAGCPIMQLCFDYALSTGQSHGVWGGRRFYNGKLLDSVDFSGNPESRS